MTRYTHGIATASWIDRSVHLQLAAGPAVPFGGLPVNDGGGPPLTIPRAFFKACQGFRFANFLEVGVEVENGKIVQAGFTPDSRGYFSDSFLGKPSHAYSPKRTMTSDGTNRIFTQIVGARTLGQEEVGGLLGSPGRSLARAVTPFAPIWSELEISLSPSGVATSRLKSFSIFPSLSYYEESVQGEGTLVAELKQHALPFGPARYDAVQASMRRWFESGWGPIRGGTLGPTHGNPWGVLNDGKDLEVAVQRR